jgi:hypothetical protein
MSAEKQSEMTEDQVFDKCEPFFKEIERKIPGIYSISFSFGIYIKHRIDLRLIQKNLDYNFPDIMNMIKPFVRYIRININHQVCSLCEGKERDYFLYTIYQIENTIAGVCCICYEKNKVYIVLNRGKDVVKDKVEQALQSRYPQFMAKYASQIEYDRECVAVAC